MPSILSEIYRGDFSYSSAPCDTAYTAEYNILLSKIEKLEKEILSALPEPQKKQFEQYATLIGDKHFLDGEGDFAAGFRLGARMMLAALNKEQ